jgi:hypothetical protein
VDDNLKSQAESLGINIDGRWSDTRLQQEIDNALAAPAPNPAPSGVPVKLLYDTWLEADVRTLAGEVVYVDIATARRIIGEGKAERADPMPGEAA